MAPKPNAKLETASEKQSTANATTDGPIAPAAAEPATNGASGDHGFEHPYLKELQK